MSKVVTLRLSEKEYKKILATAQFEYRTISNFITSVVMNKIEETCQTDAVESFQILSDKELLKKLNTGHADAKKLKGRFVR